MTFNATANGANVIRLSYTSDHYSLLVNDSDVLCPLASPGKCEALALQEARDRALAVSNLQNGDDVTQEKPTIPDGGWITVKRKNRKVGPNTPATVTADVKITGSIEVKTDGLASLASLGGDKNQDEPKDKKPAKEEDAGKGLEISQNNERKAGRKTRRRPKRRTRDKGPAAGNSSILASLVATFFFSFFFSSAIRSVANNSVSIYRTGGLRPGLRSSFKSMVTYQYVQYDGVQSQSYNEEAAARARDQAVRDAGLEDQCQTNPVDSTGALVPRELTIRLDRSAVVAPDPARDPTETTSKFWGVTWDKSKRQWKAKYKDAIGKTRNIGRFDTQEEAARAVNKAIRDAGLQDKRRMNPVDAMGALVPKPSDAPNYAPRGRSAVVAPDPPVESAPDPPVESARARHRKRRSEELDADDDEDLELEPDDVDDFELDADDDEDLELEPDDDDGWD